MDRSEHLEWAKKRALEYVDGGDLPSAIASMISDLRKHPELEKSAGWGGLLIMLDADRPDAVRQWIEGFN